MIKRFLPLAALILFLLTPMLQFGQENQDLNRVIKALENIPYERRFLLSEYGGFGSSLIVRNTASPGKAELTFVVAVPLNAEFAVDTALAMAKKLRLESSNVNTIIAFLGDELNSLPADMGGTLNKGLRDLLTLAEMPENWVLCYMDANTRPDKIILRHGISGYVAPLEIIKPLPALFKTWHINWSFRIRHNEIYKLGLVRGPEALYAAWDSEINGFVLSGENSPQNSSVNLSGKQENKGASPEAGAVSAEELAGCLLEYSGYLRSPVIKGDRHYTYFTLPGGKTFFLGVEFTAALLLIITGLAFLFFLAHSARYNAMLLFNIRLLFRFMWLLLLLLPLLVITIKISGLLYSQLLGALKPQFIKSPGSVNYTGAALTLLLAVLFFFLSFPILDLIRFPRRAEFYGFSAVLFIFTGLISAAIMDFTYVPIFLWAFIFVFLGSFFKNRIIIIMCIIIIPLIALDALKNVLETRSSIIAALIISSNLKILNNWLAVLMFALFSLPPFMLARRLFILNKKVIAPAHRVVHHVKKRLIVFGSCITFVIAVMVIQISALPEKPLPVRRSAYDNSGAVLKLNLENVRFQDSRIITVHIEAIKKPVRFDVSIESMSDESLLPLYSAPVPFERDDGGKKIAFILGENPPNPFVMEIVVPLDFEGSINASAIYNSWDPAVDSDPKPGEADYTFTLTGNADMSV